MKRRPRKLIKLGLLIFAGAILNIAVAWACAAWSDTSNKNAVVENRKVNADEQLFETTCTQYSLGHTRINRALGAYGWENPISGRAQLDYLGSGRAWRAVDLVGWPMRSLMCSNTEEILIAAHSKDGSYRIYSRVNLQRGVPRPRLQRLEHGIELSPTRGLIPIWRALPYAPVWSGFLFNTIFYAAILWLLFAIPATIKRRHRVKRGLCPHCAYDMRGTAGETCPECGTAPAYV